MIKDLGIMLPYNRNLKQLSRNLRNNMTGAEKLLWSKIKGRQLTGQQFYRQKLIGDYIVDFYCPKTKLVIELDGGQHYCIEGKEKDRRKDAYMAGAWITVLRFSDREALKDIDAVLQEIWRQL